VKKFWKRVGKVVALPVTLPVKVVKKGVEKTSMTMVAAVVRHVLTAAGGAGYMASDETVSQASSAVLFLVGLVWSIIQKRRADKKEKP